MQLRERVAERFRERIVAARRDDGRAIADAGDEAHEERMVRRTRSGSQHIMIGSATGRPAAKRRALQREFSRPTQAETERGRAIHAQHEAVTTGAAPALEFEIEPEVAQHRTAQEFLAAPAETDCACVFWR